MSTASIHAAYWQVLEVHNFGGFFGGDTVTLTAARLDDRAEETLTIDEKAFVNVRDRYTVVPSMVLELDMVGERVDRAVLHAAAEWPLLDAALDAAPPASCLAAPSIRAHRCKRCAMWIAGAPLDDGVRECCRLCRRPL